SSFSAEPVCSSDAFELIWTGLSGVIAVQFSFTVDNQVGIESLSFNYGDNCENPNLKMDGTLPSFAKVGEEIKLSASIVEKYRGDIVYSVDDESKAMIVDDEMLILGGGTITVTATVVADGKTYTSSSSIVCYAPISVTEAKAITDSLASGKTTTEYYMVEGVVSNVYNATYGNCYLTDGETTMTIYGSYSADGKTRYDAMGEKFVAGDKVVMYGKLMNYNGDTCEIKNAWTYTLEHKTLKSYIESEKTMGALSYSYTVDEGGNYSYKVKKSDGSYYDGNNVAIRFGTAVSYKNVWSIINAIDPIVSYGVDVYYVDIDETYKEKNISWDVATDGIYRTNDGINVAADGENVLFNARMIVSEAKWNVSFVATAYVSTTSGKKIKLQDSEMYSVRTLAEKYFDNSDKLGLSEAYTESLLGLL
ncbi:MAG: hypothetical protein MJ238_07445, partial [Bacilli bacterium]|nr:hypothetical protein [Bacilli bacterium]